MATMVVQAFHYVQAFSCIAERCEDSCCQGEWRIEAGSRAAALYQDEFPELLELIATDAGGHRMKKVGSQCIALTAGRCRIHATAGESALPDTCGNYPRMYRHINGAALKSATMGCPEITRLVLFADRPFELEQVREDDLFQSSFTRQQLPGLDNEHWAGIVGVLMGVAQSEEASVQQILLRLLSVAKALTGLPEARWAEQLPHLAASKLALPEAVAETPLLIVLLTILKCVDIPESMRANVMAMIAVEPSQTPAQRELALKPAWHDVAEGQAGTALEPVLKKYIAAEMTRTGFPFISTSSAGQDYGRTLVEWASTLMIRTLALRYLLLAHCDVSTRQPPDPKQLVDLIYRFCRAANHSPATAAEIELRHRVLEQA